jgi:DNA polymerase III epsilon subunit-like protein
MKLIGFDLETTGVDRLKTTPVQMSLVMREEGAQRILFNSLCNPYQPIEQGASETHGITDRMVRNMPDYAIASFNLKQLVDVLIKKGDILVTMNGKAFDIPIIDRCLGQSMFGDVPHFDVYQASCRYFPDLKSRKLGDLYRHFFGVALEGAHDAMVDTMATLDIAERIRKETRLTFQELVKDLNEPKPYAIMPFGKYAGSTLDQLPKSWAKFMSKAPDLSPDLRATVNYVMAM